MFQAIVDKWNNREWNGQMLSVKIARESFMERAAKLKQAKTEDKKQEEFKPKFVAKKFESESSSESSDSESEDDQPVQKGRSYSKFYLKTSWSNAVI